MKNENLTFLENNQRKVCEEIDVYVSYINIQMTFLVYYIMVKHVLYKLTNSKLLWLP